MRQRLTMMALALLAVGVLAPVARAEEQPKKGEVRGTVITVGEDRIVIAKGEGGQMTLEAGWKQIEGKWVRNPEQIQFFQTLKPHDVIEAVWEIDEGTHFCVTRINKVAGGEANAAESVPEAKEGRVRGKVVTVGEDRVVITRGEGGQMTLEARFVQVEGNWVRSPEQLAFLKTLKRDDQVEASWRKGDGNHLVMVAIAKAGEGEPRHDAPREQAPAAAQVRQLQEEVRGLRAEIAQLRELITRLIEQKK